jgi:hypothetical protein
MGAANELLNVPGNLCTLPRRFRIFRGFSKPPCYHYLTASLKASSRVYKDRWGASEKPFAAA